MKSAPSLRYAPLRISSAVGGLLKAYSVAASAFLGANGVESEDFGGAWSKQELFKGCALWYGVNAATFSGAEIEGGWGINTRYAANPLAYIPGVGLRAGYFSGHTREDQISHPLFTPFDDGRMTSTNVLDFTDAELRAKMLGDAIPAESFAAGRNALDGFGNYEYLGNARHGWHDDDDEPQWHHSDIKNVDYRYVQDFFRHIREATEQ